MSLQPFFQPVTRVISDPLAVRVRLAELGLTPELLGQAVDEGRGERARITAHHPRGAAGSTAYFYTVAALRDLLALEDWTIERPDNLETTVHPDRLLAIAVSAGDRATGDPDRTPTTIAEKGRATVAAVAGNQLRLWPVQDQWPVGSMPTYVLLHYYDEETEECRCELSLPSEMSGDMRIGEWRERILLPMAAPGSVRANQDLDDDPAPDINVEVERRVS